MFDEEGRNRDPAFLPAVERAQREGLSLAVSVPSFEVWAIFHLAPSSAPHPDGASAKRALNRLLKGADPSSWFLNAACDEARATALAERLYTHEEGRFENPSTGMHLLVRALAGAAGPRG